MSKLKTAYALNQKIVYPSQGGKIVDIKEKHRKNKLSLCYLSRSSDMTVMIPVERCDEPVSALS